MKVQITVRGRRYTVRSDDDVDLPAIARYVDARMAEIAARPGGALDEYTVALLAALNIAQDYERFRREVVAELDGLDRDLASTATLLDAALPGEETADVVEE